MTAIGNHLTGDDAVSSEVHDLVRQALKLAPFIKGMLGEEFGIYVSDLENYLYCEHGVIKLSLQAGDQIKESSTAGQCLRLAKRVVVQVGSEVYGKPYIGTGYPLTDPGTRKTVGALVMIIPSRQEELVAMADQVEEQIKTIAETTTGLSAAAQELSSTSEEMNNSAGNIKNEIKGMDDIVAVILNIADQTHLLGLNAAIEAARVGDAGGGFNIIAKEIRKLSQNAQVSAKDIVEKLKKVKESIWELTGAVGRVSAGVEQEAASIEEINATVNELTSVALRLKEQADDLIK